MADLSLSNLKRRACVRACLFLSLFLIKAQDAKQSVHFTTLIFSQRTAARLILDTKPQTIQLCPLTNSNSLLLTGPKNKQEHPVETALPAAATAHCIYRWWQPAQSTWLHLRMACSWQTLSKVIIHLSRPFPTGGGRKRGGSEKYMAQLDRRTICSHT